MIITGVESICCGKPVRPNPLRVRKKTGQLFECQGCYKACDHFYKVLLETTIHKVATK